MRERGCGRGVWTEGCGQRGVDRGVWTEGCGQRGVEIHSGTGPSG